MGGDVCRQREGSGPRCRETVSPAPRLAVVAGSLLGRLLHPALSPSLSEPQSRALPRSFLSGAPGNSLCLSPHAVHPVSSGDGQQCPLAAPCGTSTLGDLSPAARLQESHR